MVVAEHFGDEAAQPAIAPGGCEVLEQQAAEPEAVQGVVDEEAHLGAPGTDGLRGAERDHVPGPLDDQGEGVGIGAEVLDVRRSHPPVGGEEPEPQVVVRGAFGAAR